MLHARIIPNPAATEEAAHRNEPLYLQLNLFPFDLILRPPPSLPTLFQGSVSQNTHCST